MRNTEYSKLQLVLIAVKDWGNFLRLGDSPQKASKTLCWNHCSK